MRSSIVSIRLTGPICRRVARGPPPTAVGSTVPVSKRSTCRASRKPRWPSTRQGATITPPATLVAYRVDVDGVVDFSGGYDPAHWPDDWAATGCDWKYIAALSGVIPDVADRRCADPRRRQGVALPILSASGWNEPRAVQCQSGAGRSRYAARSRRQAAARSAVMDLKAAANCDGLAAYAVSHRGWFRELTGRTDFRVCGVWGNDHGVAIASYAIMRQGAVARRLTRPAGCLRLSAATRPEQRSA